MASSVAKNMEKKLYAMINCLADNYGFDVDAAFEYVRWETETDHVGEILKMMGVDVESKVETKKKEEPKDDESEAPTESSAGGDVMEKIAACKKNISLWEKKLADGKVKDADKQREKIVKEKAKLSKLEAKAPSEKPAPAPAKPEAKKEEKPAEKEEKEKRIKRFSPVMASQLKKALDDAGVEMNDKLKKEFQQFVEDLGDEEFRAHGLADHMRAFAKMKSPIKASETVVEEDSEVESIIKEIDELTVSGGSNAAGPGGPAPEPKIVEIDIKELQAIKMTAEIDVPGTYWDADNGRFVKGPDADEDEDFVEVKFNGKDYVVGEKTSRVYEVRESGDVFTGGYAGVGKFKGLSVA